jgi:hypothetical protein
MDKHGKDNSIIDFLSWLTIDGNTPPVEDNFLDEHLFAIFTKTPWFTNIVVGNISPHLSPKE